MKTTMSTQEAIEALESVMNTLEKNTKTLQESKVYCNFAMI